VNIVKTALQDNVGYIKRFKKPETSTELLKYSVIKKLKPTKLGNLALWGEGGRDRGRYRVFHVHCLNCHRMGYGDIHIIHNKMLP
jgi:hypothetical protein